MISKLSHIVLMMVAMLLLLPHSAYAESYSFVIGGFGSKVAFTNVSDESVVQVSQSIEDYLFEELQDCPAMELYDAVPMTSQARADEISVQLDQGNMPPEYKGVDAEYVIGGYLTNMGLTISNFKFVGVGGFSYKVDVDISVKIYEKSTGRCVYTAVGNGEANSEDFDVSLLGLRLMRFGDIEFSGECYDAALRKAVHQAAKKLKDNV